MMFSQNQSINPNSESIPPKANIEAKGRVIAEKIEDTNLVTMSLLVFPRFVKISQPKVIHSQNFWISSTSSSRLYTQAVILRRINIKMVYPKITAAIQYFKNTKRNEREAVFKNVAGRKIKMFLIIALGPYSSDLAVTYSSMLGRHREMEDDTIEKIWPIDNVSK